MRRIYFLYLILIPLVILSCRKEETLPLPMPILSITDQLLSIPVNVAYPFVAEGKYEHNFLSEWILDGKSVSQERYFVFKAFSAGKHELVYKATNKQGSFTYTYQIEVPVPVIEAQPGSSKFISRIFEYMPAPGQFINELNVGSPQQAEKLVGNVNNLLTLGAYGGYIVFGFDHSVKNEVGYDLAIYGNPIGGSTPWAEHGIVMVSQDKNGNGLPDDEWYELAGSEYFHSSTIKHYEITYYNPKGYANVPWTDNQGNSGAVEINAFHKHNYYPEFIASQEKITFKGTLLRSTWGQIGSIFINSPFDWGYTDSWSVGDNYQTNRFNSFDISWAVDKDGKKVELKTIDFVKVYTAQNEKGNALLGEISTEIKGAVDLHIK